MTSFRSYPTRRYTLPTDGKVTGTYVIHFRGDGSGFADTEGAHVNDDNPAIDYRGESYLVRLELTRDASGHVSFVYDGTWGGTRSPQTCATRRSTWSDAPRTYSEAIAEAVRAHAESVWTDADDADGADADARQNLARLEERARELAAELRATRKDIRRHTARLIP